MDEMRAAAKRKLLALAACASLSAFEELARASRLAPSTADRLVLARLAARRLVDLHLLEKELGASHGPAGAAMEAFMAPVDSVGEHTLATLWCEQAVKLAVMAALAAEFVAGIQSSLDAELAGLLRSCVERGEQAQEMTRMVREAMAAEPELQGRMTLFGRRLLGETLSQAQRVAAAHPDLTGLLTGIGDDGDDLAAISELMGRIAAAHTRRMGELGLA